tara:strand:+ start:60 stop:779 length:720 start_codon:yes stop_codon:yes gene_type:complete
VTATTAGSGAGTRAGKPLRIVILISGRGSNMLQLARYIDRNELACEIVLVAANQDCVGLAEAAKLNLPTACVDRAAFDDRAAQETALGDHIEAAGADWIYLAGYMAVLSAAFVTRFAGLIINIHPSLLPAHKGLHTHQRALDAGDTRHGASVHIVTPALDDGPLILQAGLSLLEKETAESLAARVLVLEHALYPFVLETLVSGHLVIQDGMVHWRDGETALDESVAKIGAVLKGCVIWP